MDWESLEAYSYDRASMRAHVFASLRTVATLSAENVCRSEQRHFQLDVGVERWKEYAPEILAWPAQEGICKAPAPGIRIDKSITDKEFLTLERDQQVLLRKASQVVGGSQCVRFLNCSMVLTDIKRTQGGDPPRPLVNLSFSPKTPGGACYSWMEISYSGPVNELYPWGAACPVP